MRSAHAIYKVAGGVSRTSVLDKIVEALGRTSVRYVITCCCADNGGGGDCDDGYDEEYVCMGRP